MSRRPRSPSVVATASFRGSSLPPGRSRVIDETAPAPDAMADVAARFADEAESQAQALRSLGVDARVGEVPGEYCPGRFSVNAGGETKLIGAAQRIIRGAWLFSSVVVVDGSARL